MSETSADALSSDDLAEIDRLLATAPLTTEMRAILHFAKGDAAHRRKDRAGAFASWTAANRIKNAQLSRLGLAYDQSAADARLAKIKALFNQHKDGLAPMESAPTPIFIVGTPRSGTTLLESALGAHPEVDTAGEVPAMPFLTQQALDHDGTPPADLLAQWREDYLRQARQFGAGARAFFTDKQPANVFSLGLVRRLFPHAPVIHIRRSALESGFSMLRRNFTRQWAFANDMDDVAHYYAAYVDAMAHWDALGTGAAFVQFEALVADFEGALKPLVAHCGLTWDDRCLRYYEQDRNVITFSAMQVRKPPSPDHLDSTTPYADFLKPLRDGLIARGIDPATGAPLTQP